MTVFYSVIYNTLLLLTYFDAYLTLSEPVGSASRWLLSLFDMSFLDHIATSNFIPTLQRLIFCRDTFSPFLAPLNSEKLAYYYPKCTYLFGQSPHMWSICHFHWPSTISQFCFELQNYLCGSLPQPTGASFYSPLAQALTPVGALPRRVLLT